MARVEKLVEDGFAKIGNRGDLQFGTSWSTPRLDEWLRDLLPRAFEHLDTQTYPLGERPRYPWRLLKASRSALDLYAAVADGVDFQNAKGGKSKGWQDSRIYLSEHKSSSG
jgi:hypothetical protein